MTATIVIPIIFVGISLGYAGALFISVKGKDIGLLDIPRQRSSHKLPIPKGGGIGILAAFLVCALILKLEITFWLPACVLSLFSLLGDKIEIQPIYRLIFQFVVSLFFLSKILLAHDVITIQLMFLFAAISVFVVGTTNHYNFMDGINGIAGTSGMIGFGLIAFLGILKGTNSNIVYISICMSCACAGFLPLNVPSARVFLGDVGSILLGYVFSCLVILISDSFNDFITSTSFLLPLYADEISTMFIRIKDKENLTHPHRRHLYQILANKLKISHWKISASYGILQLVVGIGSLYLRRIGNIPLLLFTVGSFMAFLWLSLHLRFKFDKKRRYIIQLNNLY